MSSPFTAEQFPPIAHRVHWRHHTAKLVSLQRQPEQFRDFATAEEAREYAKAMQAGYPHSVISTKTLHVTHPKRNAKERRAAESAPAIAAQTEAMSATERRAHARRWETHAP